MPAPELERPDRREAGEPKEIMVIEQEWVKYMTVSELVERLQRCHPEARVTIVTKITPERPPFCWMDEVIDVVDDGAFVGIWPAEADRAIEAWAARHKV